MDTTKTSKRDISPDSFIGKLNLEWIQLKQDQGTAAIVAGWAATNQAFADLASLDQIEQVVAGRRIDDQIDALFYALTCRATGSGQDATLAARILTQLMLPKAILIARTCTRELGDREEGLQLSVCALYEAIRTFPVGRRKHHIPSHLGWDTVHAVRRSVLAQTAELAEEEPGRWAEPEHITNANEKITRLLDWAVTNQIISDLDARLLAARHCTEDQTRTTWKCVGSLSVVAAETGLSLVAARKRCSRAVRRIAAAIDAYPGPAGRKAATAPVAEYARPASLHT